MSGGTFHSVGVHMHVYVYGGCVGVCVHVYLYSGRERRASAV